MNHEEPKSSRAMLVLGGVTNVENRQRGKNVARSTTFRRKRKTGGELPGWKRGVSKAYKKVGTEDGSLA